MHLAILVTNTDLSDFARRHPLDGEKFTKMVQTVRPDWECSVFLVHQNEFPATLEGFDGLIITGSPASVHDPEPWVARLLDVIRTTDLPIYGACYGHQAIALALGGKVEANPHGWSFGLEHCRITDPQPWMSKLGEQYRQFAAHKEQVTALPPKARIIAKADGVPCAGFAIDNRIYTSQNHPEMTADFFKALVDEFKDALGPEVAAKAKSSMKRTDDNLAYAHSIAAFFEQAVN